MLGGPAARAAAEEVAERVVPGIEPPATLEVLRTCLRSGDPTCLHWMRAASRTNVSSAMGLTGDTATATLAAPDAASVVSPGPRVSRVQPAPPIRHRVKRPAREPLSVHVAQSGGDAAALRRKKRRRRRSGSASAPRTNSSGAPRVLTASR